MPRPLTLSPVWPLRGDGRVSQPNFSAAALIKAVSRASLVYFNRNSIGSWLVAVATSYLNDSLAKWVGGPTGWRRCDERNGDERSSSGAMVCHDVRLLANS